jgi:hypothetical protein
MQYVETCGTRELLAPKNLSLLSAFQNGKKIFLLVFRVAAL